MASDPTIHSPDVVAIQMCNWWGVVNRMRDDLIYQAHLAGHSRVSIARATGLNESTIKKAIERKY